MDALNHQYGIVVETQLFATHLRCTCGEVVARQLHLLATEEGCELFVQQRQVQGVQILEVVVALLVAWRLVTIEEIVVERDGHRFDAVDSQLHTESFAGCGLS